jgi:hypothetical protein
MLFLEEFICESLGVRLFAKIIEELWLLLQPEAI